VCVYIYTHTHTTHRDHTQKQPLMSFDLGNAVGNFFSKVRSSYRCVLCLDSMQ